MECVEYCLRHRILSVYQKQDKENCPIILPSKISKWEPNYEFDFTFENVHFGLCSYLVKIVQSIEKIIIAVEYHNILWGMTY